MKAPYFYIQINSKVLILIVLITIFSSCNWNKEQITVRNDENDNSLVENRVMLSDEQFASGNMQVGGLSEELFQNAVKSSGILAVLPQNRAEVSPYFGGYVKHLELLPGDSVKEGDLLFTLENPFFVEVQQNFLEAKSRLAYLKADYERQKELVEEDVTSRKKFLKAEADYQVVMAQFESLKKKLRLMQINPLTLTPVTITSTIAVRSPISGFITKVTAHKGSYLKAEDVALCITSTDNLHIELKVFEQDLPLIKVGQPINVKLQNDTSKIFVAKVRLINKAIDMEERSIEIHADFLDEQEINNLIPGMYVEAEILTDTRKRSALPVEAVSDIDSNHFVLLRENDSTFIRKKVKTGLSNGAYIEIVNTEDFKPDSQFLIKGAFNLIKE